VPALWRVRSMGGIVAAGGGGALANTYAPI
jgi:hypothetical protein